MSAAKRWPDAARSDLSGGKDSRVITAMGIRSGAIAEARTIANDQGEVETAKTLMASVDTDVKHVIVPKQNRSSPEESVMERLTSQHEAFEGRYLPASAFNSARFGGFRSSKHAKFNGLGGEVMNGGSFTRGPWRDRLAQAPLSHASDRIIKMIGNGGLGASAEAKAAVADFDAGYPARVSEITGIDTASGVLDLFYNMDRMPNWSNVFAAPDTLVPSSLQAS